MHYNENTAYYEGTLMSYVKEWKKHSFSEAPFNEVDALLHIAKSECRRPSPPFTFSTKKRLR